MTDQSWGIEVCQWTCCVCLEGPVQVEWVGWFKQDQARKWKMHDDGTSLATQAIGWHYRPWYRCMSLWLSCKRGRRRDGYINSADVHPCISQPDGPQTSMVAIGKLLLFILVIDDCLKKLLNLLVLLNIIAQTDDMCQVCVREMDWPHII